MAQKPIRNRIEFGDNLNPLDDYGSVPSINNDGNLQTIIDKVDKVGKFWQTGKADGDLVRYVPNILPVTRQNLVAGIDPRQAHASETYTDKKPLNLRLIWRQIPIPTMQLWKLFYQFGLLKNQTRAHNLREI